MRPLIGLIVALLVVAINGKWEDDETIEASDFIHSPQLFAIAEPPNASVE